MARKNPMIRIEGEGEKLTLEIRTISRIELRDMLLVSVFRCGEPGHMLGTAIIEVAEKIKAIQKYEAEKQK